MGGVTASLNRYEFLLTGTPLPTPAGSAINPIATF